MKADANTRNRIIFGAASIILMLVFAWAVRYSLTAEEPYVPEDTVSVMDDERSQVYLSGKDYKLDNHTKKEHKEQQKKRNNILEQARESHQESATRRRLSLSAGRPVRSRYMRGKPVKAAKPPSQSKPSTPPESPGDPGDDQEDDDIPDKENRKPVITTSLKDGQKTRGKTVKFWVTVTDYKKVNVPVFSNGDGHFEVYVNGNRVTSSGASNNKTNFRAEVVDGKNKIKIIATDKHNAQSTKTLTIRCDTEAEERIVGTVFVSAFAPSLGIGTIFEGQRVDITEEEPLRDILSDAFKAQGITAEMSSSYLAGIKKTGIAKNAVITEELRERAMEARVTLYEREDWPSGWKNRLREKDFCSHSGWLYRVNGVAPEVGIGAYIPDDGDEIDLIFTLFEGDYDEE